MLHDGNVASQSLLEIMFCGQTAKEESVAAGCKPVTLEPRGVRISLCSPKIISTTNYIMGKGLSNRVSFAMKLSVEFDSRFLHQSLRRACSRGAGIIQARMFTAIQIVWFNSKALHQSLTQCKKMPRMLIPSLGRGGHDITGLIGV